jgi:hypothetical protein
VGVAAQNKHGVAAHGSCQSAAWRKYRNIVSISGMAAWRLISESAAALAKTAAEKIIESGASIIGRSENESISENRKWRNIIGAEKRRRHQPWRPLKINNEENGVIEKWRKCGGENKIEKRQSVRSAGHGESGVAGKLGVIASRSGISSERQYS